MYRTKIEKILESTVKAAFGDKISELDRFFPIHLELCSNEDYGDYSSPIALQISSLLELEPYSVAETIVNSIEHLPPFCRNIKANSSGFISVTLSKDSVFYGLMSILYKGEDMTLSDMGKGKKVVISASNSLIPVAMNVDYGRRLVLFNFLKRILNYVGYKIEMDMIIRDRGEMLWIFAATVEHHYRELLGDSFPLMMNTYKSKTAVDIARDIIDNLGCDFLTVSKPQRIGVMRDEIPNFLIKDSKEIASIMGYSSSNIQPASKLPFYSRILKELEKKLEEEQLLYEESVPPFKTWICGNLDKFRKNPQGKSDNMKNRVIDNYAYWKSPISSTGQSRRENSDTNGLIYNLEKQVWIKSTQFGDLEDRLFYLPQKEPSDYLLNLIMLLNALKKSADKVIFPLVESSATGFYNKLACIAKYLGLDENRLGMIPINSVSIVDSVEKDIVGETISISSLIDNIGKNALIYSFLSKSPHKTIEIDCGLFTKEDATNPIFVLEQAFMRIKNVLKTASSQGYPHSASAVAQSIDLKSFNSYAEEKDILLIKHIALYPSVICDSVYNYDPSVLVAFAVNVASEFNDYYKNVKILSGDKACVSVRLAVVQAVRVVLSSAVSILGLKL